MGILERAAGAAQAAEVYEELREGLPPLGTRLSTPQGPGKVVKYNVFRHTVTVSLEGGGEQEFSPQELTDLDRRYLEFAGRLADDILHRCTRDEYGLCWLQAEHRVKPRLLEAQKGYMQGAAGISCFLWRLDTRLRGREDPGIRLPDSPFSWILRGSHRPVDRIKK